MVLVSTRVDDLLEQSDPMFMASWRDLTIEDRNALPDEVRLPAIERYRKLTPYVEATVRAVERGHREDVMLFDRGELGLPRSRASVSPIRRDAQAATSETVASLPGFTSAEIWNGVAGVEYLVRFVLVRGGLTTLFGMSGTLKTTLALAMAFAASTGTAFFGFPARAPVGVLYLLGEGYGGARKRVRALLIEHGIDASSPQPPIFFTSAPADLMRNPDQVRATVEHASKVLGVPIGVTIIDTLTANAGPADLNDSRDMALTIAGAQLAGPNMSVLLVHHVGHGDANRERGSYSLIGAADVRLKAAYDAIGKVLTLSWEKLKDDEPPKPIMFRPRVVGLECEDEDGREVTSIVLDALDADDVPTQGPDPIRLGKHQDVAMRSLRAMYAKVRKNLEQRGDDPMTACVLTNAWRTDLERRQIDRRRWNDLLRDLQERQMIRVEGPHVYIVEGLQ